MVWINANPLFSILYYLHWFYIVFHTISKHFTLSISRSKPFSHTYLRRTASIINLVRQANTEPCTVFTTTTSGTRRTESVETGLDTHLVGPVKGLAFTQQNIFTAKSGWSDYSHFFTLYINKLLYYIFTAKTGLSDSSHSYTLYII